MSIKPFIRDTAYFQVARDRGMMPIAENFDLQFNRLVSFINNKVTAVIDIINTKKLLGEIDNEGTFLFNVGDGSVKFIRLTNELLTDYSIEWKKLKKALPASIIATDSSYEFTSITANANNQVLVSQEDEAPAWRLLNGYSVTDNSIHGNKFILNSIGAEHLEPNMLGRPLDDEAIIEPYIAEEAITGMKTAYGSITPPKIEANLLQQARDNIEFGEGKNKDVLTSRNFEDGSINYDDYFLDKKLLSLDNIGNNTLELQALPDVIASNRIDPFYYVADGAIHPYHIQPRSYVTQHGPQNFLSQFLIPRQKLSRELRQLLGL